MNLYVADTDVPAQISLQKWRIYCRAAGSTAGKKPSPVRPFQELPQLEAAACLSSFHQVTDQNWGLRAQHLATTLDNYADS